MWKTRTEKSKSLYERALKVIPGGASAASRTPLEGYNPYPVFIEKAEGSKLYDVDGNEYIDYLQALGPTLVGNANPRIINFVTEEIKKGTAYGLPFELQIKVAERLVELVPCFEKVSFMNSGTEVVQIAMRLARAYTKKDVIIRFEGNYHGWADSVALSVHPPLEKAGPEKSPNKVPIGSGIPESAYENIMVMPWNDLEAVRDCVKKNGRDIAGILVDPCMCNSGIVPPEPGYLEGLREITSNNNIILIFDEVITGFRLGLHSAQGMFGVTPDLATLAKAVGGGFPVAVYGGKAEIMDLMADGTVFRAGTLNANRVAMAAAYASLDFLSENNGGVYKDVFQKGNRLIEALRSIIKEQKIDALVQGYGSMFQIHFTPLKKIRNYRDTLHSSAELHFDFRNRLFDRGIFIRPMHFGEIYVSAAHTIEDIDRTISAMKEVLIEMKKDMVL